MNGEVEPAILPAQCAHKAYQKGCREILKQEKSKKKKAAKDREEYINQCMWLVRKFGKRDIQLFLEIIQAASLKGCNWIKVNPYFFCGGIWNAFVEENGHISQGGNEAVAIADRWRIRNLYDVPICGMAAVFREAGYDVELHEIIDYKAPMDGEKPMIFPGFTGNDYFVITWKKDDEPYHPAVRVDDYGVWHTYELLDV